AGLEEWADLVPGEAFETLPQIDDVFDVAFLDAEKEQYEELFQLARSKVEPGALIVADNVLSHAEQLAAYSQARQADPTLEIVTIPLHRGLELSVVLSNERSPRERTTGNATVRWPTAPAELVRPLDGIASDRLSVR